MNDGSISNRFEQHKTRKIEFSITSLNRTQLLAVAAVGDGDARARLAASELVEEADDIAGSNPFRFRLRVAFEFNGSASNICSSPSSSSSSPALSLAACFPSA